jgi:hypothetical protein
MRTVCELWTYSTGPETVKEAPLVAAWLTLFSVPGFVVPVPFAGTTPDELTPLPEQAASRARPERARMRRAFRVFPFAMERPGRTFAILRRGKRGVHECMESFLIENEKQEHSGMLQCYFSYAIQFDDLYNLKRELPQQVSRVTLYLDGASKHASAIRFN